MLPPTPSLETLPLLILENICEHLGDKLEKRRSLLAFSLTSRCCRAAAATGLFRQIHLKIGPPEEIESKVQQWTAILQTNSGHRYVRQLKVSYATTKEDRSAEGMSGQDEEHDPYEDRVDWELRFQSSAASFLLPSNSRMGLSGSGPIIDQSRVWMPLCHFIHTLPGLQDLVWAYNHIAPTVLNAIHTKGCRLHLHYCHPRSLIQPRGSLQPISLDDYRLATSPSLSSLVVRPHSFTSDGMLNYTEELVEKMVSGMAPNLKRVRLTPFGPGDTLKLREAIQLGKPAWPGLLLPKTGEEDQRPALGRLQSLEFDYGAARDIVHWASLTDFTTLRRLSLQWRTQYGIELAEMAMRGTFRSLQTLRLLEIHDETAMAEEALHQMLKSLDPLQSLTITGYISSETFDIILHHHGALRNLSLFPYRDRYGGNESQNNSVVFSEPTIQQLAQHCPKLQQLSLPIGRTRGDDQETAIYRALSIFPQLKYLCLTLQYSVGPDEEYWDEERDGEHPITAYTRNAHEIPTIYLSEAFSNSAIDAHLALNIFKLISGSGSLRHLRLCTRWKTTVRTLGVGGDLQSLLRWLNRSWACTEGATGDVRVVEIDKKGSAEACEAWREVSEDPQWFDEIFGEVFKEIWPPKTAEWWKNWTSLPLSEESI